MTELINFEITKTVSDLVIKLNKDLIDDLSSKIKSDVVNSIIHSASTKKSIFGLDDIKDLGKIYKNETLIDNFPSFDDDTLYPIIIYYDTNTSNSSDNRAYKSIPNILNGKKLSNDEIFIIFVMFNKYKIHDKCLKLDAGGRNNYINTVSYLPKIIYENKERLFADISSDFTFDKSEITGTYCPDIVYDMFIRKYFDRIIDYKLKAIKYDEIKDALPIEELQRKCKLLKDENTELKKISKKDLEDENRELKLENAVLMEQLVKLQEMNEKLNNDNELLKKKNEEFNTIKSNLQKLFQ